ncbi:DUF3298 domain-containing protein [Devosia sp.]|uniref:DUF3298 domain-containing protein n=1 Tax=Devosia sp. TaxID=1871048 RepID=UPI0032650031
MRKLILSLILLLVATACQPAFAASFDCNKAATPTEHAICDTPELSHKDDVLAKAFATAIGGLSKAATNKMRNDEADWLAYVDGDCTDDGKPLTSGEYTDDQKACLGTLIDNRIKTLEDSRMLGGFRFYLTSKYAALVDPDQVDNPEAYTKLANYDGSAPLIDGDDDTAMAFNAFILDKAKDQLALFAPASTPDGLDATSDTSVRINVNEVTPARISLKVMNYYFGHGAAHGGTDLGNYHFLISKNRPMEASDIFKGTAWKKKLLDLAVKQVRAQLGDNLMLDDPSTLADLVIDPYRWSFGETGLEIQFEQYEVTAYAMGAPVVTVSWDDLTDLLTDDYNSVVYGY